MPEKVLSEVIKIPAWEADMIQNYLENGGLGEDETIIETAEFEDGKQMDIKCCGVQEDYDDPDNNRAWTEAVLFTHEGFECGCSEPWDFYLGEWEIENDDVLYHVDVVISDEEQR